MKKLNFLIAPCFLVLQLTVASTAVAEEAEAPPGVAEIFFCSYNANKDRDDLLAARDYYLRQSEKAGIKPPNAFVWHAFKGEIPYDFLWMGVHENLQVFGQAVDAGNGNAELDAALARFDDVASCQATVAWARPIFVGDDMDDLEDPTFIQSSVCEFRKGSGLDSLGDFANHIRQVAGGSDQNGKLGVYGLVPMTNGPSAPDAVFITVRENAAAWAAGQRALYTTEPGQSLLRHRDTIMKCNTSLWHGEQVVGG